MSPTPGLGEDDDDPLLDDREMDMLAVMVVRGMMEFELLRLPPQCKTVGLGPSSKVGGARGGGHGWVCLPCITPFHTAKYMCVCKQRQKRARSSLMS